MDLAPILKALKEHEQWELISAASAIFFKLIRGQAESTKEAERAAREGSMSLTPDGWAAGKPRFDSSDPIQPR